ALVRPAPTSEPASGSVSTIVVSQPLSTMCWAIFFSRSLALRGVPPADTGPAPYIQTAGLAPSTISPTAHSNDEGAGVPPSSANVPRRQYSASIQARWVVLSAWGTGAVWVSGSKTGGVRSASSNDAASSSRASRSTSL